MTISCSHCFHLKRLSDGTHVFCDVNRLGKFVRVLSKEIREDGVIEFGHRRIFRSAFTCPTFDSMDDESEFQAVGY